jgi:glycosyltransferase involved in cell wall biosynthesis
MLSKWYPFDQDPQFGVFIRKQAFAASAFQKMVIWSAHFDHNPSGPAFRMETGTYPNLTEYRMYYKKSTGPLSSLRNAYRYLKAWRKSLKQIIAQHGKPSILQAYILLRPAVLAFFYCRMNNIPLLLSEQWSGYATGKFQKRNYIIRRLCRYVWSQANFRTTVSEFLKKSMIQCGFRKDIHVIPNVIEIAKPQTKILTDHIRILVVADLTDEIKNLSGVLRAFDMARKAESRLRLQIIGHGKDEGALKELSQHLGLSDTFVTFDGLKDNKEVYTALWQCDFLVMNSRFETFSLICAEALSCGKPVIATRCGGPEEFINEHNGILIPVNDDQALCDAILKMTKEMKSYHPEKLREEMIRKFSPAHVGEKISALYGIRQFTPTVKNS